MLPVKLENDSITIGNLSIRFQRTLRIPDDGRTYPLPPSLGSFPVHRVEDFASSVPAEWLKHGGVFFPMYQREAMWMSLSGAQWRPQALKVAVGMVNAISGGPWSEQIGPGEQDYLVVPGQPWLDGIKSGDDTISQFIAMPLGMGYTVEGQVTGEERFGGLQLVAFDPKSGIFPLEQPSAISGFKVKRYRPWVLQQVAARYHDCKTEAEREQLARELGVESTNVLWNIKRNVDRNGEPIEWDATRGLRYRRSGGHKLYNMASRLRSADIEMERVSDSAMAFAGAEMGLGAGGTMRQKVYEDAHGWQTWDSAASGRVYVHIVNSQMYKEITGREAPQSPISARTYSDHGYPWYDLYDEHLGDVGASEILSKVKTVKEMDESHGFKPQQNDDSIDIAPSQVVTYPVVKDPNAVSDGDWNWGKK